MTTTNQQAHTSPTSSISPATSAILAPLKAAATATLKLGDKKPIPTQAKPRKTGPVHRIVHADCLDALAKIPDRTIDFICADFPYNISGKGGLTLRNDRIVKADFGDWDKFPTEEAYLDFVFKVCAEYRRILKPNASMVLFF